MRLGLVVVAGLLCPLALAKAEGIATPVSGSGGGVSGTGTLVTLSNGNGSYTITSITGTGVTGLINPDGFGTNDNLLFPDSASGLVDQNGFSFTDVMGDTGYDVNLVSDGLADGNYLINLTDTDGDTQQIPAGSFVIDPVTADATGNVREFSFSFASVADAAAVTPEPSSIALLGTGLLGVAGLLKRRGE